MRAYFLLTYPTQFSFQQLVTPSHWDPTWNKNSVSYCPVCIFLLPQKLCSLKFPFYLVSQLSVPAACLPACLPMSNSKHYKKFTMPFKNNTVACTYIKVHTIETVYITFWKWKAVRSRFWENLKVILLQGSSLAVHFRLQSSIRCLREKWLCKSKERNRRIQRLEKICGDC